MSVPNHDETEGNEKPGRPTQGTVAGICTHVAVTAEQIRFTMLAAPDFKPATYCLDAAANRPVYEKTRFLRAGDRIIVALVPCEQPDGKIRQATEVWAVSSNRWS